MVMFFVIPITHVLLSLIFFSGKNTCIESLRIATFKASFEIRSYKLPQIPEVLTGNATRFEFVVRNPNRGYGYFQRKTCGMKRRRKSS